MALKRKITLKLVALDENGTEVMFANLWNNVEMTNHQMDAIFAAEVTNFKNVSPLDFVPLDEEDE